MKKISLVLTALSALLLSSLALAQANSADGYYTSQQHPMVGISGAMAPAVGKATDIRITNGSSNIIHITVPNAVKMDAQSGISEHIYNDNRTVDTEVVLQGPNGNVLFDAQVCRYALITVHGDLSTSYGVDVNRTYCN